MTAILLGTAIGIAVALAIFRVVNWFYPESKT